MMGLQHDLNALRAEPGVHLETLRKVDAVLGRYAGQRLTVLAGAERVRRLAQASALLQPGMKRPRAIRVIAGAVGVSEATSRRYYSELQRIAEATAAHHVSQKGGA